MNKKRLHKSISLLLVFAFVSLSFTACFTKGKKAPPDILVNDGIPPYKAHGIDGDTVEPLSDVYNILLIGTDILEEGEAISRADTIIIVSIDPKNDKIKLTSVLRDCYMEIPNHGKQKLNRAYTIGGADLLVETVATNLDIPLKEYVEVDFTSFRDIIDILGGVSIDVFEKETKTVFGTKKEPGTYLLTGQQALSYARIRKLDNDFYRSNRQRTLLYAVYQQGVKQSEDRLFELMYKIYPLVDTSLSITSMVVLLYQYFKMKDVELAEQYIPADGTFEEIMLYDEFLLNIDLESNQVILNNFIYQDKEQDLEIQYK